MIACVLGEPGTEPRAGLSTSERQVGGDLGVSFDPGLLLQNLGLFLEFAPRG
jgi:hypothetical protein